MLSDELLRAALDEAIAAGADYAEGRVESAIREGVHVRDGAVERLSTDRDSGWGVHALAGGGWGFASSSSGDLADVRDTARQGVAIARASGSRRKSRSDLSAMPTWAGEYVSTVERDPFSVPVEERVELALEVGKRISAASPRV